MLFVCVCQAANMLAQTPPPPRRAQQPGQRPVLELRTALGRFANGTAGFSETELGKRIIGFAPAKTENEFALAYYMDRGDNAVHAPLYLALSTKGQPWKRASLSTPANILGDVTILAIGRDYLLANTGLTSATREIVVFSKALTFVRATGGALAMEPFANDTVLFSENRLLDAPALRTSLSIFNVHSGAISPLYPGVTPVEPSPAYAKVLQGFVKDLNQNFPKGNSGRGYRDEWYAAFAFARPEYDKVRDAVTFTETIAPTWPMPKLPNRPAQVENFIVSCGPMSRPGVTPRCIPGRRTIDTLKRDGK
jgi:hypothetical protein